MDVVPTAPKLESIIFQGSMVVYPLTLNKPLPEGLAQTCHPQWVENPTTGRTAAWEVVDEGKGGRKVQD